MVERPRGNRAPRRSTTPCSRSRSSTPDSRNSCSGARDITARRAARSRLAISAARRARRCRDRRIESSLQRDAAHETSMSSRSPVARGTGRRPDRDRRADHELGARVHDRRKRRRRSTASSRSPRGRLTRASLRAASRQRSRSSAERIAAGSRARRRRRDRGACNTPRRRRRPSRRVHASDAATPDGDVGRRRPRARLTGDDGLRAEERVHDAQIARRNGVRPGARRMAWKSPSAPTRFQGAPRPRARSFERRVDLPRARVVTQSCGAAATRGARSAAECGGHVALRNTLRNALLSNDCCGTLVRGTLFFTTPCCGTLVCGTLVFATPTLVCGTFVFATPTLVGGTFVAEERR